MNNAMRLLVGLIVLLSTSAIYAESASAPMMVSVQVIARAIVTIESQPGDVVITPADIARGYVDVSEPIVVRVRTNSRQGYSLHIAKSSEAFSAVELSVRETVVRIAEGGSALARPYVPGGDVIPVHARLLLAANATAGRQSLPVSFDASPL